MLQPAHSSLLLDKAAENHLVSTAPQQLQAPRLPGKGEKSVTSSVVDRGDPDLEAAQGRDAVMPTWPCSCSLAPTGHHGALGRHPPGVGHVQDSPLQHQKMILLNALLGLTGLLVPYKSHSAPSHLVFRSTVVNSPASSSQ